MLNRGPHCTKAPRCCLYTRRVLYCSRAKKLTIYFPQGRITLLIVLVTVLSKLRGGKRRKRLKAGRHHDGLCDVHAEKASCIRGKRPQHGRRRSLVKRTNALLLQQRPAKEKQNSCIKYDDIILNLVFLHVFVFQFYPCLRTTDMQNPYCVTAARVRSQYDISHSIPMVEQGSQPSVERRANFCERS